MKRIIKSVECKVCHRKHISDKSLWFCPDCHAYLPESLDWFLSFVTILLFTGLALLLNLVFPATMLEDSPILNSRIIRSSADRIMKIGNLLSSLLGIDEPDKVYFLSPDKGTAIDTTLFLFVVAASLGIGIKVYRLFKYPVFKWFGWIYEKQTDSWIAIPRAERTRIGDFIFSTTVQSPGEPFKKRRYIALGIILTVVAEIAPYFIITNFSTNISDIFHIPLIGLFLICITGLISGLFGYSQIRHIIIGGILAITLLFPFFILTTLFITGFVPITGPDFEEKLGIFISLIANPSFVFLLHYPAFIIFAILGKKLRIQSQFRKRISSMSNQVSPAVAETEVSRLSFGTPPLNRSEPKPHEGSLSILMNYKRAQQNLDNARNELEYVIANKGPEKRIKEKEALYLLARKELADIENSLRKSSKE